MVETMINGNKIKNTGSMRLLHTQTQHKYRLRIWFCVSV